MIPRFLLVTVASVALAGCARSRSDQAFAGPPGPAYVAPSPAAAPLVVASTHEQHAGCAHHEQVLDCAVLTPSRPPHMMAMAVSGRSIGLVWTTSGNGWVSTSENGPAYFEILDERLEPVHRLTIPGEGTYDVAVAAWRSGWLVATSDGPFTVLRHVGADGSMKDASLRLDGGAPHLAVNAHGEVLVVRTTMLEGTYGTRVSLLTDLDEPARFDVAVIEQPVEPRLGSVVALDDGFLVAQRGNAGVEVVHVGRSGRLDAHRQQVGSSTEYPKLAACGATATMVWADFSHAPQLRWTGLDARGRSSGEPITLGTTPDYFDPSPGLCDELGSIVLLGGYTGGTGVASHLELVRVDGHGRAGELVPVLDGLQRAYDYRLDRLDGDMVVAWIELGGTLGIARLATPSAVGSTGLQQAR